MNGPSKGIELAPGMRGKLVVAIFVFGLLAVLSAGHAAVQVHGYFETRDSLEHWQGRLEEGTGDDPSSPSWGIDSPARRIRALESELDRIQERFFVSVACFLLFGGFVFLGVRAWKRARP